MAAVISAVSPCGDSSTPPAQGFPNQSTPEILSNKYGFGPETYGNSYICDSFEFDEREYSDIETSDTSILFEANKWIFSLNGDSITTDLPPAPARLLPVIRCNC